MDWTRARWNASWTIRYIHGMTERCSDFLDGTPDSLTNLGLCSMPDHEDNTASRNHLASTTYHDVQATYTLPRGNADIVLALGVNNLLDRDPPPSQSASINGYDASVYDIPGGRFVYFRVAYCDRTVGSASIPIRSYPVHDAAMVQRPFRDDKG